MIPRVIVLEPGRVVHKIYNGYWFLGRPTLEDLGQDLRAVTDIRDGDHPIQRSRIRVSIKARSTRKVSFLTPTLADWVRSQSPQRSGRAVPVNSNTCQACNAPLENHGCPTNW